MTVENTNCPKTSMMTSTSRLGHSMFAQDRPGIDPRTWANNINRPTKSGLYPSVVVVASIKDRETTTSQEAKKKVSRLGHSMFAQDRPGIDPRTWAN